MPTTDGVSGHHRDHRFGGAADLHLQVEDVEPTDPPASDLVITDVAVSATDSLIPTTAERRITLAGQDDDTDLIVITRSWIFDRSDRIWTQQ